MNISKVIAHKDAMRLEYEEGINCITIKILDYEKNLFLEINLSISELENLFNNFKTTLWKFKEKKERK